MPRKTLKEIIKDTEKDVSSSTNALAKLYRTMLLELGVNAQNIEHFTKRYLDDQEAFKRITAKDRSSVQGNLIKQLGQDSISWKIFMKGINLLRPQKVTFTVTFTDQRGKTTIHSVNLTGIKDDNTEEEEDESSN